MKSNVYTERAEQYSEPNIPHNLLLLYTLYYILIYHIIWSEF